MGLINDLRLIGLYGLRCKREVWSQQLVLAKLRKAARILLTMDEEDPRRIFEGEALIRRMVRLGLLERKERKLDFVLGLTVSLFMERRLQTLVHKRTLAKSIHELVSSSAKDKSPSASSSLPFHLSWFVDLAKDTSELPLHPSGTPTNLDA